MYSEIFPWEDYGACSKDILTFKYQNHQLGTLVNGLDYNGTYAYPLRLVAAALSYRRIRTIRQTWDGDPNSRRTAGFSLNLLHNPNYDFLSASPSMFKLGTTAQTIGVATVTFNEKDFVAAEEYMMELGVSKERAMSEYFRATALGHGKEKEDIELYIKQQTGVTSYVFQIDDWRKTYIILRKDDNFQKSFEALVNALASCLPRLLPWLFEGEELVEEEKDMLNALLTDKPGEPLEFQKKVEVVLEGCNGKFRSFRDTIMLAPFLGYNYRALLERNRIADRGYRDALDHLSNTKDRLREAYRSYEMRLAEQAEISKAITDKEELNKRDEELAEYFASNKAITSVSINNGTIRYEVLTPLKNFDPDIFDSYVDNDYSILYSACDYGTVGISVNDAIRLLRAIFETEEVELMMTGCFDYLPKNSWRYRGAGSSDGIQNPHLYHYNCFGDYGPELDYANENGDIVAFAENSIASVSSINLGEACTIENFLRDLFYEYPGADEDDEDYQELNESRRFRYDGDSTLHTLWDTIQYLNKKDAEN